MCCSDGPDQLHSREKTHPFQVFAVVETTERVRAIRTHDLNVSG